MANFARWIAAAAAVAFLFCETTKAQIDILKRSGDKTISCMHTGLSSDLLDCGAQSDWYSYVFVGTISGITSVKGGEKELHIIPEDIFKGAPTNPLIVRTSQGDCFDELSVGNRWLFFLRSGNPIVLDFYGNASSPMSYAQERVGILRRLQTIGDNGILMGQVRQGPYAQGESVPDVNVVAHRVLDNAQFIATADANGRYEFPLLDPGKYKIAVDITESFHVDDSSIEIKGGQCWDLTLSRSPHGRLAGHVKNWDGSPASNVAILIANEDGSGYTTTRSDKNGFFQMEPMSSGKYIVAVNAPGAPEWKYGGCGGQCEEPTASLYYPNVSDRAGAVAISLATDEKRDDIDFTFPAQ